MHGMLGIMLVVVAVVPTLLVQMRLATQQHRKSVETAELVVVPTVSAVATAEVVSEHREQVLLVVSL
jgi:hypothetical protein